MQHCYSGDVVSGGLGHRSGESSPADPRAALFATAVHPFAAAAAPRAAFFAAAVRPFTAGRQPFFVACPPLPPTPGPLNPPFHVSNKMLGPHARSISLPLYSPLYTRGGHTVGGGIYGR